MQQEERLHICQKCQRFLERRGLAEDYLTILVSYYRNVMIFPTQNLNNSFSINVRYLEKMKLLVTTEHGVTHTQIKLLNIHPTGNHTFLACRRYMDHYVLENN